jgi:general secretion pathway protein M
MSAVPAMPPALAGLRQQAVKAWNGRTLCERQALALVALVLVMFLVWVLFVQPAVSSLRAAPAQLDRLDAQMQQMQRLAAEGRELRGIAPVSASQATAALKSATDRLGTAGKITLLGDRATLTLNGVSPELLRAWLSEARNGARARPVEAQLTRGPKGYSGSLSVNLAGAP